MMVVVFFVTKHSREKPQGARVLANVLENADKESFELSAFADFLACLDMLGPILLLFGIHFSYLCSLRTRTRLLRTRPRITVPGL